MTRQFETRGYREYAEREQLVSVMNETKWREVAETLRELTAGPPSFRIKDIRSDELWPREWDREWFYHSRPFETIEWLEIRSEARNEKIVEILRGIGAPCSIECDNIRIWGWLRPGTHPSFL